MILLAAIWGSSFLFMRILSPALGPVVGADVRLLIGVALMSRLGPVPMNAATIGAIGACVIASICYGWAGVLIRRCARTIPSLHFAAGTQLAAGFWILPFALAHGFVSPPVDPVSPIVIGSALAIGVLCSAVAYMLYFRLMADVGPTRTLTVTFIIPVWNPSTRSSLVRV